MQSLLRQTTRWWVKGRRFQPKKCWTINEFSLSTEAMAGCQLLDRTNVNNLLDSVDAVLFDCDGVLWHVTTAIEGVPETVQKLRDMGKRIFFVTNNSTKSREEYVCKLHKLGYQANIEEIVGSAFVAAQYLKETIKLDGKVFVVGSTGITQELDQVDIPHIGVPGEPADNVTRKDLEEFELDPEVKCVVVGFDNHFNYLKLTKAITYLAKEGCLFVATNLDSGLPLANGKCLPGTGSLVKAVEFAAQREPDFTCGKPNKPMFEVLQQKFHLDPARTLMVGDRMNTDILLAYNCGLKSLLVLTGFNSLEDARKLQASNSLEAQKQVPDFYLPSLADLGKLLGDFIPK